jgi:hypothetical protein
VRDRIRTSSFDLHARLLQHYWFFAERSPHNLDSLAQSMRPSSYSGMLLHLKQFTTLLPIPSATNFGKFVRDLAIPLRLVDASIRALRMIQGT